MNPTSFSSNQTVALDKADSKDINKSETTPFQFIWLLQVAHHSGNFSCEDLSNLAELSVNVPNFNTTASPEIDLVLTKVRAAVANKKWDPTLPVISMAVISKIAKKC